VRIGHEETHRLLHKAKDPNRPAPTVTFDDRYQLRVGGQRLQLAYHGPNHSPDNIFIYAPDQQTLMVVDVLFPGWAPFKNLAVSQDIPGWIAAHDVAMRYPWTTLVGGHSAGWAPAPTARCSSSTWPTSTPPRGPRSPASTPRRSSRSTGRPATPGHLQDLPRRGRPPDRRPDHHQVHRPPGRRRRLHHRQRLRE